MSRSCCPDYRAECREGKLAPPSQEDEDKEYEEFEEYEENKEYEEFKKDEGSCRGHCGARSNGTCW